MKSVFIIVPSLSDAGPVIGALALANGLSSHVSVTFVPLKPATRQIKIDNSKIRLLSLADIRGWRNKKSHLIKWLQKDGDRNDMVSISSCFSADMFNLRLNKYARIISSVRGNLLKVYRLDFGLHGFFAALLHYIVLHKFDHVVAISQTMAKQLRFFGLPNPVVICNFIDEPMLENYRQEDQNCDEKFRFVFLGRLTALKRPFVLIQAFSDLVKRSGNYRLDIIGDGPLLRPLKQKCKLLGLAGHVKFHGYLSKPYILLQQCQFLVLPSETEGISRAVMEALFFGLPCIVRDVDANKEIISEGVNGFLFKKDSELVHTMEKAVNWLRNGNISHPANLLPASFRQDLNIEKYMEIINSDP